MYKQIPIPGLEPPPEPAKKLKASTGDKREIEYTEDK